MVNIKTNLEICPNLEKQKQLFVDVFQNKCSKNLANLLGKHP